MTKNIRPSVARKKKHKIKIKGWIDGLRQWFSKWEPSVGGPRAFSRVIGGPCTFKEKNRE